MYNEIASLYGGTMATGYVLLNIDPQGTPSTSLGPRMGMESTSLSRTLKNMENKGLIFRRRHDNDGRIVLILLTAEGKKMRDLAKSTVLDFNQSMREIITQEKLEHFFEVTRLINSYIESRKRNKSHT